jgi:hypothetical protein
MMTEFEDAVLGILARSAVPLGWYNLERRLSNMSFAQRPHLMNTLESMRDSGLLEEVRFEAAPSIRYVITDAGRLVALRGVH